MDASAHNTEAAEAALLALRVVKGVHAGARIPIASDDILVVGCADDCEVILSDNGVSNHHCIVTARDAMVWVRPVDAALVVDGQRHRPGQSVRLCEGTRVELGAAVFEITTVSANEDPTDRDRVAADGGEAVAAGRFRRVRWALATVIVAAVACGLQPVMRQVGPHQAQAAQAPASAQKAPAPKPTRAGADIARDVAEVLRLSGISAESLDNGHGTITVRGHLGDPKAVADVVQSRAMREIEGLKRVLVVNLDQPSAPLEPDETRIVSAVASHDPYIVTADGSRYYVGAKLPHGGRLAGIEEGTVLVERDGRVERLRLPGASFGG